MTASPSVLSAPPVNATSCLYSPEFTQRETQTTSYPLPPASPNRLPLILDSTPHPVSSQYLEQVDTSYNIENITNISAIISEWDDDDVDEILIISPKAPQSITTSPASTLSQEKSLRRDEHDGLTSLADSAYASISDLASDDVSLGDREVVSIEEPTSIRKTPKPSVVQEQDQSIPLASSLHSLEQTSLSMTPVIRREGSSGIIVQPISAHKLVSKQEQESFWQKIDDECKAKRSPRLFYPFSRTSSTTLRKPGSSPSASLSYPVTPLSPTTQCPSNEASIARRIFSPSLSSPRHSLPVSVKPSTNKLRKSPFREQPDTSIVQHTSNTGQDLQDLGDRSDRSDRSAMFPRQDPPPYSIIDDMPSLQYDHSAAHLPRVDRGLSHWRSMPCLRQTSSDSSAPQGYRCQAIGLLQERSQDDISATRRYSQTIYTGRVRGNVCRSSTNQRNIPRWNRSFKTTLKKLTRIGSKLNISKLKDDVINGTDVQHSRLNQTSGAPPASLRHKSSSASQFRLPRKISMASLRGWSSGTALRKTQTDVFNDTAVTPFDLWEVREEDQPSPTVEWESYRGQSTLRLVTEQERNLGRQSYGYHSLPGKLAIAGLGIQC